MEPLVITIPANNYQPELGYILEVIIKDFLGLEYLVEKYDKEQIKIMLRGDLMHKQLIIENVLFNIPSDEWLKEESLPPSPFSHWVVEDDLPEAKVCDKVVPIIYGKRISNGRYFSQGDNFLHLGLDVFGSSFFMLTQYEELVLPERDEHERFPAKASLAFKEGFLERPIVDEYCEILWSCMKRLWPKLERKKRDYRLILSHDVDHPLCAVRKPWYSVIRNSVGDMVRRKDMALAFSRLKARAFESYNIDPYNTFDFIMNASEQYGMKSAFYFKSGFSNNRFDVNYSLDMPWIQDLMRSIYERGHEIGLHTSYETYRDLNKTLAEFRSLLHVANKLGIVQQGWGGRQHYLRWKNPITWRIWEKVGLDYDSTLGFAEHVGFRCGTCYEFRVFDLEKRKALHLRERPLIAMDGTLFAWQYMALQPDQALKKIQHLSSICCRFNGVFTLLWHNSSLAGSWQKRMYLEILRTIAK